MYTKRIQVINYGPIERLDLIFPFDADVPKPVVLVGENGSGKSILLSHIVNGLISAKDVAYSETPEMETGKVFKLRSNSYIKPGCDAYFSKVDFESNLFIGEIRSKNMKREYPEIPTGFSEGDAIDIWGKMDSNDNEHLASNIFNRKRDVTDIFANNCVLYFPPNRFEEPAWMNEDNLKSQAQYMDLHHIANQTNRKVLDHSPLRDNQNWLFDVIYDRATFEILTPNFPLTIANSNESLPLPVFLGYSGNATSTYESALQIVRSITRRETARFGIGKRLNRFVSIESEEGQIVPNIFQLSSGETSLLNLFLSILRDFDLCGVTFSNTAAIRGIVVVDEIDLHLHAVHQYAVLPELIKMFPKVQFVFATHSPLVVLGMQRVFGEDGFDLYRLPRGHKISPEEFSEFGDAYRAFTTTSLFANDIRTAIETAQKPIVFVEGATDKKYLEKAAALLGREALLDKIGIQDGRGSPELGKIWNSFKSPLADIIRHKVVLLFDSDTNKPNKSEGNIFQRVIPLQDDTPIRKGIENLFETFTVEKARQHKQEFIDTIEEHNERKRGVFSIIPEEWSVNGDEKTNLCNWLCDNGTQEDFRRFGVVFDIIEAVLDV